MRRPVTVDADDLRGALDLVNRAHLSAEGDRTIRRLEQAADNADLLATTRAARATAASPLAPGVVL